MVRGSHGTEIRENGPRGSLYRRLAIFDAARNTVDVTSLEWSPNGRLLAIEAYQHSGD